MARDWDRPLNMLRNEAEAVLTGPGGELPVGSG